MTLSGMVTCILQAEARATTATPDAEKLRYETLRRRLRVSSRYRNEIERLARIALCRTDDVVADILRNIAATYTTIPEQCDEYYQALRADYETNPAYRQYVDALVDTALEGAAHLMGPAPRDSVTPGAPMNKVVRILLEEAAKFHAEAAQDPKSAAKLLEQYREQYKSDPKFREQIDEGARQARAEAERRKRQWPLSNLAGRMH